MPEGTLCILLVELYCFITLWLHCVHTLFEKDVDYIVKDGEIVIVDEHTGRTMAGRRWSDGLHQAIEAKEGVDIKSETKLLRQFLTKTTSVYMNVLRV